MLLDVLRGEFEVTAAIMSGQMQSDNFTSMMAFKRAFRFDKATYMEFCEWEVGRAAGSPLPATASVMAEGANAPGVVAAVATITPVAEAVALTAALPSEPVAQVTEPPAQDVVGVSGVAADAVGAEAAAAPVAIADAGLEQLRDDYELYVSVRYLFVAFEESSMSVCLHCHLSHEGSVLDLGIEVSRGLRG